VLFAKAPRLHEVKTRLEPVLTAGQALWLHEAMLHDQLVFVNGLLGPGRSCELCLDRVGEPRGELARAMAGMSRTLQGEGDLGARLHRALTRAFDDGAARVAVLGSDAPTLPRSLVEDALTRLRGGADAVVIPALDGGYVLVGASHPVPALFAGVPWGTSSVLDVTRRIAVASGLVLALTAPWPDVDVASDLARLRADLAADPARAPETAVVLTRLGLYSPQNPVV